MSLIREKLLPYPFLYKKYDKVCFLYEEYIRLLPFKYYHLKALIKKNKRKTILSYPEKPVYYHLLYQICYFNGFTITNKPQKADCFIHFEDTTYRKYDLVIRKIAEKNRVINYRCWDISKKRVEKVHKQVFGYNLSIDPQAHRGNYLRKGNLNTLHDGVVLSYPEEPRKGYVYQRLVNNIKNGEACDIRLPIFGKIIPFAYLKYRPPELRFSDKFKRVYIVKPDKVITNNEYKKILELCHKMGLDYGELDVLRDNDTKKLFIVDVNNTPAGPSLYFPMKEKIRAIWLMSDAFQQAFL